MAGAPYSTPPIVRVGRPARAMAGMPLIGGRNGDARRHEPERSGRPGEPAHATRYR